MAGYCHGANAPYGCGHHAEHVRAAKLGWARRKGAEAAHFEGSDEQRLVSAFLGDEVNYAHTHAEHPNTVVFKSKGKWYELPKRTFNSFVRGGREQEREQAKARREQHKRNEQHVREQIGNEKLALAYARQEHADVSGIINRNGGIRYVRTHGGFGAQRTHGYDRGEWLSLPASVRNTKSHYTMDQAADQVNANLPHLRIESGDDLIAFYERNDLAQRSHQARIRSLQSELDELRAARPPRPTPTRRRSGNTKSPTARTTARKRARSAA